MAETSKGKSPSVAELRRIGPAADLASGEFYLNRELSWLEFNARVLEEAEDPSNRLLERVKFLSIISSNFDEFFMIRVAGIKRQALAGVDERGADRLSPAEQLARISEKAHALCARQYKLWREELRPKLAQGGIEILSPGQLSRPESKFVQKYFTDEIFPVLTPLAIDPGHPFPHLLNLSLNLAVLLERSAQRLLAVVQVPNMLARLVPIPSEVGQRRFLFLEDVIALHLDRLFPGLKVRGVAPFRVTRDSDLAIAEDEAEDLLLTIEKELREREWGRAVRLEVAESSPAELTRFLVKALDLGEPDVYRAGGPLDLADFQELVSLPGAEDLKDPPHIPAPALVLQGEETIFDRIRQGDVLLHHPYDSFSSVVDFISKAAGDPEVLAIKQTLYRTGGGDSPIIRALERAASNKKQVTALVELKARFDEANNIIWARALEEAGVHVVYGLIGLKTHCKITLVVRKEPGGLRRYVHLGTGNYNPATARIYTDLGLLSANPALADDVSALFNLLTGYADEPRWQRIFCAPTGLQEALLALIRAEEENARSGRPARIVAQLNGIADAAVVQALYRAGQAGVEIDLICRGLCILRPGIPGVSDHIRVRSIVGKFLEHERIFFFEAGGEKKIFLSSADWMERNFRRRVEVVFPVESPPARERILEEILPALLGDNTKARLLRPDGTYVRAAPAAGEQPLDAQQLFVQRSRERAEGGPDGGKRPLRTPPAVREGTG